MYSGKVDHVRVIARLAASCFFSSSVRIVACAMQSNADGNDVVRVLTTLNAKHASSGTAAFDSSSDENDAFIRQSAERLKQAVAQLLENPIFRHLHPAENSFRDEFQWLLHGTGQLTVTFQHQYCTQRAAAVHLLPSVLLTSNRHQHTNR